MHLTVTAPPGLKTDDLHFLEMAMLGCPARKMLTEPPTLEYAFSEKRERVPM